MKTYYNENNKLVTTFSSEEEKETIFHHILNKIKIEEGNSDKNLNKN